MIPNGEVIENILTDNSTKAELQQITEALDMAFSENKPSISWIYTVYDLLVRYKALAKREYEIKFPEDSIV